MGTRSQNKSVHHQLLMWIHPATCCCIVNTPINTTNHCHKVEINIVFCLQLLSPPYQSNLKFGGFIAKFIHPPLCSIIYCQPALTFNMIDDEHFEVNVDSALRINGGHVQVAYLICVDAKAEVVYSISRYCTI